MECSFCSSEAVIAHCDRCEASCCLPCIGGLDCCCACEQCHVGIEKHENCDYVDDNGVGHVNECENCVGVHAAWDYNDTTGEWRFVRGVITEPARTGAKHSRDRSSDGGVNSVDGVDI